MQDSDFVVLLLKATAQPGCSRPQGTTHKIIAIVLASTYQEARRTILMKLAEAFWSDIHIEKYGPLLVDTADTNYLNVAVADAYEHEFGVVVYETKN